MSKTPQFDAKLKAILEATQPGERLCPISGEVWVLTQEDLDRCRIWNVPPPTLAPLSRMKELAGWGAGIDLWWKPHALTEKPTLSGIHPDAPTPIITDKEWYEKDWGIEHPLEYDSDLSVFDQARVLFERVPYPSLSAHGSVNSVGCGMVECVDCFMAFGTKSTKDGWYTIRNSYCERMMDCAYMLRCENVYASAKSVNCNTCIQIFECNQCLQSAFLFDCQNCEDCFCSSNLRRKQYVFLNEQLTEAEYKTRMKQVDLSSTEQFEYWKSEFRRIVAEQTIWPENFSVNVQNCVGEGMMDSLNCSGFLMANAKDVRTGWNIFDSEHLDTVVISYNSNDCYYTSVALNAHNVKFSFVADYSSNCEYVMNCYNCEYCFACVGLNRKKFCILNKQYDEAGYWEKLDEIKCAMLARGEYGRFFPAALSPLGVKYGYAYVLAPFTEDELKNIGGRDDDPVAGMRFAPYGNDAPRADVLTVPDRIDDVADEWVGVQFQDKEANRRYTITQQELAYRKENRYDFPRRHYTARLKELVASCNGPIQQTITCAKCNEAIMVSHSTIYPTRTIYCKPCYYAFLESR